MISEMDEVLGPLVVGDAAHLLRISTARQRSGRCTCNHSLFVGTDGIHHRLSPLALPERSRRLPSKPPSSPLDRATVAKFVNSANSARSNGEILNGEMNSRRIPLVFHSEPGRKVTSGI